MSNTACATCKFWWHHELPKTEGEYSVDGVPDEGYGECRRHPPVLRRPLAQDDDAAALTSTFLTIAHWSQPCTLGNDWCGEWIEKLTDQ